MSGANPVTIDITSLSEPSRHWSASAAPLSPSVVSGLPPATYRVVITTSAGAAAPLDVELQADEVVLIELSSAAVAKIAGRHFESQGTHITGAQLRALPSGAGLWGVLDMTSPFVIADRIDGGGLGLTTPPRVGSRGASWRDTTLQFDRLRALQGPDSPDQIALVPDLQGIDAVVISSGLAPASVASPGATVALVPRRSTPGPGGAFDVSFTAPGFVGTNDKPAAPAIGRLQSWRQVGVQYGGPAPRRAGFFVSGSMTASSERDRGSLVDRDSSVASAFAHVVANMDDRNQVRAVAAVQRAVQPFRPFRAAGVAADERDLFFQSEVVWERFATDGARIEAVVGVQRGSFVPDVKGIAAVAVDRVRAIVPVDPVDAHATRFDGQFVASPASTSAHTPQFGVMFSGVSAQGRTIAQTRFDELAAGVPARVWMADPPDAASQRHTTTIAAFATDRWQLRPNATLDAGLRLSRSTGSATGASQGISWSGVLPRIRLRWSPALLTAFVGYGRYQDELQADVLAFGDPGEPLQRVYRWNDANGDRTFQSNEAGALVALAGRAPSVASIDPDLKSPHTDEFTFGGERTFGGGFSVSATGVVRREGNVPRSVNAGVPLSSYQARPVPDQGVFYDSPADDRLLTAYERTSASFAKDRYLLTNVLEDTTSYEGIEIAASLTRARWWSFAGASAYRTQIAGGNRGFHSGENDQGVVGELFENPNANSYARGRSFFDRGYALKWATGFDAPGGVSGAVVARYQDGQPFARLVVVPDLAQGAELVTAYPNGRTRFTFTATIDARLEKRFAVGTRAAAIRLEIYNLPNLGLEVEEDPLTGADFRRTTAVQPPRTVRVGFHVAF